MLTKNGIPWNSLQIEIHCILFRFFLNSQIGEDMQKHSTLLRVHVFFPFKIIFFCKNCKFYLFIYFTAQLLENLEPLLIYDYSISEKWKIYLPYTFSVNWECV